MDIQALAAELGFAGCFVFTTEPFVQYERRLQDGALHWAATNLTIDIMRNTPWANAILALISPYHPYDETIPVSGYYPSSNAAYHASAKMMQAMQTEGIQAARADVPVRELLTRNGIGTPLKNGLTLLPGLGTRYSVQTLVAQLPEPQFTPERQPAETKCKSCHACEHVCPSGAIDAEGFHFNRCARSYMEGSVMEPWVMDALTTILGCELCQRACVHNCGIETTAQMPEAFRLEEILAGRVKPVLAIVGNNLNKQGRIIQHACVVAAKQGRTDLIPLIEPWLTDRREGVRVAAAYALEKLAQ